MTDTLKNKGQRKQLSESLRKKGFKSWYDQNDELQKISFDEEILIAIEKVPRHLFVDKGLENHAYEDKALPIAAGQTISQPYTVAFQTQLMELKRDLKVLEIGTGSGYQSAILVELGTKVFSIERQEELYKKTYQLLNNLGYVAKLFYGDGYKGLPSYGPFDRILVTAGAPQVPYDILSQLKKGGIMVIPVGDVKKQVMTVVKKIDENQFETTEHGDFLFVPMLTGKSSMI